MLLAVVPVVFLLPPLLLVMMVGGGNGACGPIPTLELAPGGAQIAGLNPQQTRIAATAVGRVGARKLPAKAAIIVIAVGLDESGLRSLSNPAVPESMSLPNDGVGFDGGSIGYLQQQPQYGWGTAQELMNPAIATDRFLDALIKVPGWQSMDPAQAATTVQRNATGAAAYQEFIGNGQAGKIVDALSDNSQVADYVDAAGSDAAATPAAESTSSPGTQVKPMKDGTYEVSSPFGQRGSEHHRGIDLAAPNNTPIYAAGDGEVIAAGPASGFGQWIVINHRIGGKLFATVYGHMYADGVLVKKGQKVTAGQEIGKVGSNGQSSGPHLHFEVWDGGHEDFDGGHEIDPTAWATTGTNPSGAAGADTSAGGAGCTPQAPVPGGADIPGFRPGGPAGPNIVAAAASQMGIRYSWGGGDLNGPTKGISDDGGAGDAHQDYAIPGWDCSGLSQYAVHKATGKVIPDVSQTQSAAGIPVPDEAHAEPGDLVFFGGQGSATHVGIYMGGGKMVNAPESGAKVRIDDIHNGFSQPITFRRYH